MSRFVLPRIAPSEITDEKHFWDRRTWLATVGGTIAVPRRRRLARSSAIM